MSFQGASPREPCVILSGSRRCAIPLRDQAEITQNRQKVKHKSVDQFHMEGVCSGALSSPELNSKAQNRD